MADVGTFSTDYDCQGSSPGSDSNENGRWDDPPPPTHTHTKGGPIFQQDVSGRPAK